MRISEIIVAFPEEQKDQTPYGPGQKEDCYILGGYSKSPTYDPPSCERSKMWMCAGM